MSKQRYLTKSRFKQALECSAKLYYTGKKEYVDNKLVDSFLAALAEGGFQVGELSKIYFEGGSMIDTLDPAGALEQTNTLLQQDAVIIYEAAFLYQDLFIRADIVRKKGKKLDLIEVKSKSYDPSGEGFLNNKGQIRSEWFPYLFDLAFQYYVLSKACPELEITPYLMLADKSALTTIDGLNQMFVLEKDGQRLRAIAEPGTSLQTIGKPVLVSVAVTDIVNSILQNKQHIEPFESMVQRFSNAYSNNLLLPQALGSRCAACEFKATADQLHQGQRSGFHECWSSLARFSSDDFSRPSVLTIWRTTKKESFIQNGIYFQEQLTRQDLAPKKETSAVVGLNSTDRQWLQVKKNNDRDTTVYLDFAPLRQVMADCTYPLHFIDFETTAVAIPFNQGRRPYEQIAFQFSHHTMDKDGDVSHADQWINVERGKFPNFEFVRNLKQALEKDNGTIFRYAAHENSILVAIHDQLKNSQEPDRESLCSWIQSITHSSKSATEPWTGPRDMVDLLDWVKSFYYNPLTNGSNSIKNVLPAMLHGSDYLKQKYSQPIYGTEVMKSFNFSHKTWITYYPGGKMINPYQTLPLIHEGLDNDSIDNLFTDEESGISDGGAAMTAYARMQFSRMPETEFERIKAALLRYCELDTLAMVMLWEGLREECNKSRKD